MTKAEMTSKLEETKKELEAKVTAYNSFMMESKLDDAIKADAEIQELKNQCVAYARDICFVECAEAEDPMMEAIRRLEFDTVAIKDVKSKDEKFAVREIQIRPRQIDLLKLHMFIKGENKEGIGKDKNWNLIIEKFNLLMTCKVAKEIEADVTNINDSYAMSKLARDIDLGKNPCSNTNMLKTLTAVVQAMIGEEFKPVSHDVKFIERAYVRKSRKALTVTCANHNQMRGLVMEVCHRIVTGKAYDVEYKKARN